MPDHAYRLITPDVRTTSVIFASPHSGRAYPEGFLRQSVLNERDIRSSEDAYVDDLFQTAPVHGAPLIAAQAPRAFIDLNRAPDELDPALIENLRRGAHNPRVASGLGVIPRVVSNGRAIYRGKLPLQDAYARIHEYWQPYHDRLQSLLDEAHHAFGEAILIDCHSMPHEALDGVGPPGSPKPDVVLGDRFGASAASGIVEQVEAALASAGFRVARNMPFAGAFICQHYGRPTRQQHVIQVEIDRSLYMDEGSIRPNAKFAAFQAALADAIGQIAQIGRPMDMRVAAE